MKTSTPLTEQGQSAAAFWAMVRAALDLLTSGGFFIIATHSALMDNYPRAIYFLLLVFFINHFDVWRVRRDRERDGDKTAHDSTQGHHL